MYNDLRSKASGLEAVVFALNGTEDHVHLVAAIPPKIAVATFIGKIKAVAATKHNRRHPNQPFYWQEEYGVFSFDHKRLPNFVSYVERQKEHHAQGQLIPVLERLSEGGVQLIREPQSIYQVTMDNWWQEMLAMN